MRIFLIGMIGLLLPALVFANEISYEPLLNQVSLQLDAERWVISKTALVTVGINASVSDSQLEKIQTNILAQLKLLTNKGEWHLASFNRSLDQSGLERIQMSAQIRLASTDLVGLRDKAKALSKPGETFTLDNIEFTPSAEELQQARSELRKDIYQQAQNEIIALNTANPNQHYFVHALNFIGEVTPGPRIQMLAKTSRENDNLSVGDKLKISALLVVAAAPTADVIKLVHG